MESITDTQDYARIKLNAQEIYLQTHPDRGSEILLWSVVLSELSEEVFPIVREYYQRGQGMMVTLDLMGNPKAKGMELLWAGQPVTEMTVSANLIDVVRHPIEEEAAKGEH